MKKRSMLRRLGTFLSALSIAAFLWGCGQNTITGVDARADVPLTPAEEDPPGDGGTDGWW